MAGPSRSPGQHPRGQDHHVGHPALGQLGQQQVGLEDGRGAVRGADLLGLVHLERQGVDRDDVAGPGDPGPLDGARPDAAAAHHHDRLARPDLGPVDGRAEPGRDAAADQGGRPERHLWVDLHERGLVGHHRLGERAELGHPVHVLTRRGGSATARHPSSARPGCTCRGRKGTGGPRRTRSTAAGRDERRPPHGPRRPACRRPARPRSTMPAPSWPPIIGNIESTPNTWRTSGADAHVAGAQVLVGVAHSGIGHLDHHLVGPRGIDLDLLDLPRLVESGTDGGADLHMGVLPLRTAPLRHRWLSTSIAPAGPAPSSRSAAVGASGGQSTRRLSSKPVASSRKARSTSPPRSSVSCRAQQAEGRHGRTERGPGHGLGAQVVRARRRCRAAAKSATTSHHSVVADGGVGDQASARC